MFDNHLLAWIPLSENIYFDALEFLAYEPIEFNSNFYSNIDFGAKKITKIYCNNHVMHSIADDGNVYSWGNDRDKTGILGLGFTYIQANPVLNTNFANKKIIDISLSEKHGVAMDSIFYLILVNRHVYTWGTGLSGELGKENITFSNTPLPIELNKHSFVMKIQCGATYTAFLDCIFLFKNRCWDLYVFWENPQTK